MKTVIAIHALQGAGKTTVCDFLEEMLPIMLPSPRVARVNVKDSFAKYANMVIDTLLNDGLLTPEEVTLLWRKEMFKAISICGEKGKQSVWSDAYKENVKKALLEKDVVLSDDCRTTFNIDALRDLQKSYNVIVISLLASENTRKNRCSAWREGTDYTEKMLTPQEDMNWFEVDAEKSLEEVKDQILKIVFKQADT